MEVITWTRDTFKVLRQTLRVIDSSSAAEHFHGEIRTLAGIMHVLYLEVTVLIFHSWYSRLSAAIELLSQILGSTAKTGGPGSNISPALTV